MSKQDKISQTEVFSGEFWQVSLIKQLLEEHGIYSVMSNEYMSIIEPAALGSAFVNRVNLLVSQENYQTSLNLIEEYNNSEPLAE
jgi:putative signal transducing protein